MNPYLLLNIAGSISPHQEIVTFEGRRQNYEQLIENTGRLAALFAAYDIGYGDRIGIIATNLPEVIETFFAAFQLGAVVVPLNYRAKADELAYMIQDAQVRVLLVEHLEAEEWLRTVEREKVTHAFLVPTMLKRIIDHPRFQNTDLSSLQSISYGAAPMPLPVIRRAIELFPSQIEFSNAYGMTETTSTVTILGPEDHRLTGSPEEIEKKIQRLSSVGRPLPGVEIKILDDEGRAVEAGVIGHVYIRTGKAMKGYWNRPDDSSKTLVDGWVNTQDMGWLDEDGYLFLVGRNSDMIIRGGENISPQEVEDVLLEHPEVAEVAVIGVPSLEWGEEVMAVVVPTNPFSPPEIQELLLHCTKRLASFKRPSKVVFVNDLPRTSTGKVKKKELRDKFARSV